MKSLFGLLVFSFVLVMGGSFAWLQMRHAVVKRASPALKQEQENAPSYAEEQEARGVVTIHGPLMDYMARPGTPQVETLRYVPRKPGATDRVAKSVAGGTVRIVQQTFPVRRAVQVAFEVPAHAATPRLFGNYHASLKQGSQAGDTEADVEFLVLNQRQYAAFLKGVPGEATFSASDAPDQEVNASLPPTFDKSEEYHLIFRNNSKTGGSKMVQADFRVDF